MPPLSLLENKIFLYPPIDFANLVGENRTLLVPFGIKLSPPRVTSGRPNSIRLSVPSIDLIYAMSKKCDHVFD